MWLCGFSPISRSDAACSDASLSGLRFQCYIYCVAGEIVSPLTERTALEVASSTQLAPEASSTASAFPTITAGSEMSTITHHLAVLPLSERQAPPHHSTTSTPPATWNKSLTPHMARDNSPTAVTAEQQTTTNPSQQSSLAESSPCTSQQVAALTDASTGIDKQEQHSSPLPKLSNQTVFDISGSHAAFEEPQVHSQDGPVTALSATGDAGASILSATLNTHTQTRRENSSWAENHTTALGSPALPGFSLPPGSIPSPAMDHSEYAFSWACTHGSMTAWEGKLHPESRKMHNFLSDLGWRWLKLVCLCQNYFPAGTGTLF